MGCAFECQPAESTVTADGLLVRSVGLLKRLVTADGLCVRVSLLSVYCAGILPWSDLLAATFTCIGLYCTDYIVGMQGW
jgi:hypothetical protein